MRVAIITESCFGNTAAVADALAGALRSAGHDVTAYAADDAPPDPEGELILLGAPTHNRGLPGAGSRSQAISKGGSGSAGAQEWIAASRPDACRRVVTFATRSPQRFAGSAAKAAAKAMRRRGWRAAEEGEAFIVTATADPLRDGELDRAADWARVLG